MEDDPSSGQFGFDYDTAGRLITQSSPTGEDPPTYQEVGYQLDENGNRTRLIWPDAYYADYLFDELNRLTDIKLNGSSSSAIQIDYDDLSRRTLLTYANGCSCAYTWTLNNDLQKLQHNFVGSSVTFKYGYNKVHQVTNTFVSDKSFLWTPSSDLTLSYGAANELNQYPSVDFIAYGYDENGNLTSGPFSATFDDLNRPIEISNGATNRYSNDPFNRQVQKEIGSAKTTYLHAGFQIIKETSGGLAKRYIPGARLDETWVQIVDGSITNLHQDLLGSSIAQTSTAGEALKKYSYSPFGETPDLAGTIFGFTGQRYDEEIKQYSYKTRQYDPALGRFLQPDPIGYIENMNSYVYVNNDPTNNIDPWGLMAGPLQGGVTFNAPSNAGAPTTDAFMPITGGVDIASIITGLDFSSQPSSPSGPSCGCGTGGGGGGSGSETPRAGGGTISGSAGGFGRAGGGGGPGGGLVTSSGGPLDPVFPDCTTRACCRSNQALCTKTCKLWVGPGGIFPLPEKYQECVACCVGKGNACQQSSGIFSGQQFSDCIDAIFL